MSAVCDIAWVERQRGPLFSAIYGDAPLRGSAGARCPRCAWARLPRRGGLPPLCSGRPSLCSASPLRFAWARRVPPPPSASRLRARGAPAPGACAALRAACSASGPRGFGAPLARCSRAPAPAALPVVCGGGGRWVLPCLPPPPLPPPLGARGVREASGLGAPPRRCAAPRGGGLPAPGLRPLPSVVGGWFRCPLPPRPPRVKAALRLAPLGLARFGLDIPSNQCYHVLARPVPLLRGLPSGYPWTAKKPLSRKAGRFFYALRPQRCYSKIAGLNFRW